MANNYYTYTDTFTPGLKARSGDIDREYLAIQTAFDLLPTNNTALTRGVATYAGDSVGAGNAYEVVMPNTRLSNQDGDEIIFVADKTNTGASTFMVDAIAPLSLRNWDGTALAAGAIVAGRFYAVRYDATAGYFVLTASTNASINAGYAAEWANKATGSLVSAAAGGNLTDDYSARHQADAAQDWAIRAEDDPVPVDFGGDAATTYSAYHWAQKASAASGLPIPSGAFGMLHVNAANNAWIQSNDFRISTTATQMLFPQINSNATPALAFGDGDTGIYEQADDNLGFVTGGGTRMFINTTHIRGTSSNNYSIAATLGIGATAPIYTFRSDEDTGISRAAADQLSLIAGGIELLRLVETGLTTTDQLIIAPAGIIGTAATPALAFGDGDSGFYESSDDVLWAVVGGSNRFRFQTNFFVGNSSGSVYMSAAAGSAVAPTYAINADTDTGLYAPGADQIALTAGGVRLLTATEDTAGAGNDITSEAPLFMLEQSAAKADVAGYGQFWVRNDTPNVPMFTDDAGNDYELIGGGGGGQTFTWAYDDTVAAAADPGSNEFRTTISAPSGWTAIYFSDVNTAYDGFANDILPQLFPGCLIVARSDDDSVWALYIVDGTITDNTTWWNVPVQYIGGTGATAITAGAEVTFTIVFSAQVRAATTTSNTARDFLVSSSDRYWEGTNVGLRTNPSSPPTGGRLQIGTTLSSQFTAPAISHQVGNSSQVIRAVWPTATTSGYYERAEFAGVPDFIEIGWRTASVDTNILYTNNDLEYRFLSDMVWRVAEKAAAAADLAAYGQFWVRNDTANTPMFTDDAGNDFDLRSELYTSGAVRRFGAIASGIGAIYADSSTDTENTLLQFQRNNSAVRGQIGFISTGSNMYVGNQVHGGQIILSAETAGGTSRNMLTLDPGGAITGIHDGSTAFFTTSTGFNVNALYINEQASAGADTAGDGQIWVKSNTPNELWFTDDAGSDFPVAYAVARRHVSNAAYNINTAGNEAYNGVAYYDDGSNYTITLENSTSTVNMPVDSALQVINAGSGTITITEGTSTTLYYLDGAGAAVTDTAGGCTLGTGAVATIYRASATVYVIYGSGITP